MKSNRQARHILGLDYRISNQQEVIAPYLLLLTCYAVHY